MENEIIIDTSSILFAVKFGRDAFDAAAALGASSHIAIPTGVIDELRGISNGRGSKAIGARTALKMLRIKNVKLYKSVEKVDDWIYHHAMENPGCTVITNDTELFKRLKGIHSKVFKISKNGSIR